MMEKLKSFPFILIFLAYAAYLGLEYYQFQFAPDGKFEMHQMQMKQSRVELDGLKKKLAEGQKFMQTLDIKKEELRGRVKKLSEYQGMLSEGLDVPSLIKMMITETKRIQLKVDRIEPGRKIPREFYLEQEFKMDVKGSYFQMVLLAQRISQLQRILRIESFSLKPSLSMSSRVSNQLDGQLSVRAYQYTSSKEDVMAGSYR
jgi:Tfp pilus assembly protein PilO